MSLVLAAVQYGGYVNPYKAGGAILLLIIWVKLLAWMDKDAIEARLPRDMLNAGMMAGLIAGYFLFFFLPGFGLALGILLGLFVADIVAYFGMRSRTIGLGDLTDKLKDWWASLLKRDRAKQVKAVAGEVLIMDKSGSADLPPAPDSPEALRFEAAQQFLTKPLRLGAERLDLVAGEPAGVHYFVDGMRYEGDAMDRNKAGAAVQYLKSIAELDMNERRKPQSGTFKASVDGKKYTIQITSQGSTQGESVKLITNPKDRQNFKIDALGFSEEQLKTIQGLLTEGGVVLLGAPRQQGLTSLCYAMLRAHDAFLYHVHTIERAPEFDLEGATQNALAPNAPPAEEAKQVSWVVSQEPDVLLVSSLEDPQSATDLAKFAAGERRVYVGLRAGSSLDALRQWRKLVNNDALAMKNLKAVIVGRLVRRLCAACKIGYTPDPNTLKKLNMNPDVVGKLYQARKEPMRDAKGNAVPCNFCNDLAFNGRFGIFEVMVIDDDIRNVIAQGGSDSQIKQAQRGKRTRSLQEMALAQVQAGETSVEEVLRVLKPDAEAAKPRSGGSPPPAAGGGKPPAAPRGPAPRKPSSAPRPTGPR
jgi:type II secretory ATPase GspE/PulE/Tfp pilus assembly ATPase PilB-like protein